MTLTDTGALVALLNARDSHHPDASVMMLMLPPGPLLTTWPCFTEAMYLLGRDAGFAGQDELWSMYEDGTLTLRDPAPGEPARMAALMRTYRDLPMDLADASLVTAAEATGERRLFTFDAHFRVYVLADGASLAVVP